MATNVAGVMRTQGNTVTVSKTLENGMEVVYTATSTPGNSKNTLKELLTDLESDLAELFPEVEETASE